MPAPTLERLLAESRAQRWATLAIGERVARFGLALEGVPYVERTLEGPGPEVCRVTTDGFDCVTFMETALGLARTVHADRAAVPTPGDVTRAITYTRYRGGQLDGYTSRLHYVSEWIADNVAKGGGRYAVAGRRSSYLTTTTRPRASFPSCRARTQYTP